MLWDHSGGVKTGLFIDELFDNDVMYLYELRQALGCGAAAESEGTETPEDTFEVTPLGPTGGEIKGTFDEPALTHPEERYEFFLDDTDGSEEVIYYMLDAANDEAEDIAEHGALLVTEHQLLDKDGKPSLTVDMSLQDSPYGKVCILKPRSVWMRMDAYSIGSYVFSYDGKTV